MLENFLVVAGRQNFADRAQFTVGQSITDACMGWDMSAAALYDLASVVRGRRALRDD